MHQPIWSSFALLTALLLATGLGGCEEPSGSLKAQRLQQPPPGKLYHGVFPGGSSGMEDDITPAQVRSYEQAAGTRVAWVSFSHNWYQGTAFPKQTAQWIHEMGAVPYIRLMLREEEEETPNRFSLEAVLDGAFDGDLRGWARQAAEFPGPLIVEFGTECNGDWFPWNGSHHGAGRLDGFGDPAKPDGPERFAATYRHIVDLMRAEGARNITWVFHVDSTDSPEAAWNRFENYYPGDGYVDWVAVSAYGPQEPTEDEYETFREQMDGAYPRLERLAPGKPVIVAEFGCTAGCPVISPEKWAGDALSDILGGRWPRLIGFSWWDEQWENDDDPAHNSDMKIENTHALGAAFRKNLAAAGDRVVERPIIGGVGE